MGSRTAPRPPGSASAEPSARNIFAGSRYFVRSHLNQGGATASKKEEPVREGPLPAHFVFKSNDLYSRSGFEGGAIFRHAFPHLSSAELRDLLVEVLNTRVIPWLDNRVQTLLIPTVHNPLRAVYVGGVPVSWTAEAGQGPPLTPATVRVSIEDVLECARKRKIAVSPGT